MEKKTFMQKLKNMGPAAIITSAFIGPWHHYHRYPGGR